eukprot:TRINITY_DN21833_c0_g1_i1.p1 TRINITY_DN21833_c0_g1~~TRINITY_DN21833_c0_g1_i1.p1  ORF type:complete len:1398 (-),score=287.37 TRINITY_DN21833_c0_g1_i1:183-4376(-)
MRCHDPASSRTFETMGRQDESKTGLRGRNGASSSSSSSATPEPALVSSANHLSGPLSGLSTTAAHERLVEEVEQIVGNFMAHVQAVTWRSRLGCLSFPQSHEGGVALICSAVLLAAGLYTLDASIFVEVLLLLPAHFLAWYISFRLPRVEQLRAIAKVQECIQKFVDSDDAFTSSKSSCNGVEEVGRTHEVMPPSSFCVSVLRDRAWRQTPYNMLVAGDIFRLREGESFPCRAEQLIVQKREVTSTGVVFESWQVFQPATSDPAAPVSPGACSTNAGPVVSSFRALSTACLPNVKKFLQQSQRSSGRMDTVFVELAEHVRERLKRISLAVFLLTSAIVGIWMLSPAVAEQPLRWQLRRALAPLRLVVCLLPLMHTILLQLTDVWGNARIQSLFEWHAGLADEEREDTDHNGDGEPTEEVAPGSGEIDASRVPLRRQLRELLDILRQGLDGPANLMHTLNSTTVVCFCDKEGLLTDTSTTITEVCLCSSVLAPKDDGATRNGSKGASDGSSEEKHEESQILQLQTTVLDVIPHPLSVSGLRFEESDWRQHVATLKPLGLAMAVSRQPRELPAGPEAASLFNLGVADVLHAMHRGGSAAMADCLCNVSQLVGFKEEAIRGFDEKKFSMELSRPVRAMGPDMSAAARVDESPAVASGTLSSHGARSRALTPNFLGRVDGKTTSESQQSAASQLDETMSDDPVSRAEPMLPDVRNATNYSKTMMTWFVQDSRDGTLQMFCKAKPKRLLPRCTHYFDGQRVRPMTEEDRQKIQRLVLQWKASGLAAAAYAYRPLVQADELAVPEKLARTSFFCSTEGPDGTTVEVVEVGGNSSSSTSVPCAGSLADQLAALQKEQVFLGMAGVKLCASMQMASYTEALHDAGIRLQIYCSDSDKRTRTLGSQLGMETGWNCLISLEAVRKEVTNMHGQVVLPSGIPNIRTHTRDVDNVPLLVSLFSKSTPWRAQQMIDILQEHAECVTCVGSALQPNFETFRQANISVSVLVGAVPRCRSCHGQRQPRPGFSASRDPDLFVPGTVSQAEFQLSADLTSLPCAMQAHYSYSAGEQRTLGVLFNAIKEARRCVDCILMVLIHYLCGAIQLAVLVALHAVCCLPAPIEGAHVLSILFVLLPAVSLALLFNAASPQLMRELPLKKADEKTLAQPARLMALYAVRSVPSAVVVVIGFMHDLHMLFSKHLSQAQRLPIWASIGGDCADFSWLSWFSGHWPQCVKALSDLTASDGVVLPVSREGDASAETFGPWSTRVAPPHDAWWSESTFCTLTHAQQWAAFLFVLYEVTLAFTFLDRYDSLMTRGPASNKVLIGIAALALVLHTIVSYIVVSVTCKESWHSIQMPTWDMWLIYVALWPACAVLVSEATKRHDRRYHMDLQRTLRVLFNTRLGMWSPK